MSNSTKQNIIGALVGVALALAIGPAVNAVFAQGIRPSTDVVIPAVPEQRAQRYWAQSILIVAPNVGSSVGSRAVVELVPFNTNTGQAFPSLTRVMTIDNVIAMAQTNQAVGSAMVALQAAIEAQALATGVIE